MLLGCQQIQLQHGIDKILPSNHQPTTSTNMPTGDIVAIVLICVFAVGIVAGIYVNRWLDKNLRWVVVVEKRRGCVMLDFQVDLEQFLVNFVVLESGCWCLVWGRVRVIAMSFNISPWTGRSTVESFWAASHTRLMLRDDVYKIGMCSALFESTLVPPKIWRRCQSAAVCTTPASESRWNSLGSMNTTQSVKHSMKHRERR